MECQRVRAGLFLSASDLFILHLTLLLYLNTVALLELNSIERHDHD